MELVKKQIHMNRWKGNVTTQVTLEDRRCPGIAGELLGLACADMAALGADTLYLLTDHDSFYERYGWEFFCMVRGDGEEQLSRMYRRRTK